MAENKTQPTTASVAAHLNAIADPDRRRDAKQLARLLREVTGTRPAMWGPTIVGFGSYDYTYASGRTGTSCVLGFASRTQELVLYGLRGAEDREQLLARLGPHREGKGCVYVKRLADLDLDVLRTLAASAWAAPPS